MHEKEEKNVKLFFFCFLSGRGSVGTMVKSFAGKKLRAEKKTISHLFVFQQLQNHKFLHCHGGGNRMKEHCWIQQNKHA
jgi:hypothetical protein